jgi:hypothetical protein
MSLVIDLVDRVEKLFSEKPDKRKKVEYKDWVTKINLVIDQINKETKFKMYDKVK